MRVVQRKRTLRALCAGLVGTLLTIGLWEAGPYFMAGLLLILLTMLCFAALTIATDAIAHWRQHPWRWWWRQSDDEGPFWAGTRIPRHPHPSRPPARSAALPIPTEQ